jgi:hypothetical protein
MRAATAAVRQFSQNTTTLTKLVGSVGKSEASGKSELRDRIHVLINDNKKIAKVNVVYCFFLLGAQKKKDTNALLKRMNSLKSPDAREQVSFDIGKICRSKQTESNRQHVVRLSSVWRRIFRRG